LERAALELPLVEGDAQPLKRDSLPAPRLHPTGTDIAKGKGWSFRKTKHDVEVESSHTKKKKTPRNHPYVLVELVQRLFE
jgi:hypothetical protein